MKLSKKRLAQIIKEEYQRFQEEKDSDDKLEAEYKAAKQKLDKGATPEKRLGGLKDLEDMVLRLGVGHPSIYYILALKAILDYKQKMNKGPAIRRMSEEEHAEPVGAGIEDISAGDVLGNQPGSPFPVGSQAAFEELFIKFRKRDGTLDYAKMMEVYENLDEKNKKEFVEFILRNPLIFNNMKQSDVDFALDLDPDAPLNIDMSDYEQGAPESKEEEEEDMDSIVKDIQRLMKDPRSTS